MKTSAFRKKYIGIAFIVYVALTIALSIGLSLIWQAGIDPASMTHEELLMAAKNSFILNYGAWLIGIFATYLIATVLTLKTQQSGYRSAFWFGIVLTIYGVVSILLNLHEPLLNQALKVMVPVPLSLLAGWVVLPKNRNTPVSG